ncbi:MAG: helix-hairpin-helix domain-containing protein, partial [Chloroflexi bacterium]|nr:helix-hairpin-helix domain-containing protein [Chloroflexota bacterium]
RQETVEHQPIVTQLTKQVSDMQSDLAQAHEESGEHQSVIKQLTQQITKLEASLDQAYRESQEQQSTIAQLTDQLNAILTEDESILLENINGLGAADILRLKAAGISSVRDLARATPAQIETVLKPPLWRRPDYEKWIRYARILARAH